MKELIRLKVRDIKPYPNNPRNNDYATEYVKSSIQDCGFINPIIIDEDNVVLAGHTRLKAIKKLGYEYADCLRVSGMNEQEKRKYRLLDNKVGEIAGWDYDRLYKEIEGLDFGDTDYLFGKTDFTEFYQEVEQPAKQAKEKTPAKKKCICPVCGEVFDK